MPPAVPKDPAEVSWHLDRRVPVALIATIVIQTGMAIWWASGVSSNITTIQQSEAALTKRVEVVEGAADEVDRRLVRFEVLLEAATEQLKEQRTLLTEIRDSVGPPKLP